MRVTLVLLALSALGSAAPVESPHRRLWNHWRAGYPRVHQWLAEHGWTGPTEPPTEPPTTEPPTEPPLYGFSGTGPVCPASCPSSCKTCYYCANEGSCAKEDPQAPWTKAQCDAVTKSGVDAMWCGSDTPDPEECTCPEECPSGSKGSCYFCEQKMCTDWPVTQCVSTPNTKWCGPPGPPAPPAPPALECKQTCPFWDGKEGGFDWENLDLPPKLCPQPILKPELTPLQKALLPGGVGGPEIGYSFDPATSPFEPWKADVCNHDFASIVHGGPAACLGPGCTASANCSSWDGTGAIPKINGCTGQSNTLPDTAPSFASYYDIVEAWGVGAYDREMAGFMAIIASGEASPSNHEASNPKCNGLPCTLYDATDPNGIWQMTGLSALSFFDICKIDPSKIPKGTFPDDSTPSAYAYAVMNNPCCTARLASYWVQNYDPDNHQCTAGTSYRHFLSLVHASYTQGGVHVCQVHDQEEIH